MTEESKPGQKVLFYVFSSIWVVATSAGLMFAYKCIFAETPKPEPEKPRQVITKDGSKFDLFKK